MLYNRIVAPLIYEALEARGWSVSKLAIESQTKRSVLAAQLSGTRRIRIRHLAQYLLLFNHQELPKLLVAWLRDNFPPKLVEGFLNDDGDDLHPAIKAWTLPLNDEDKVRLEWWAREMQRDGELEELFKLLSARAGYRGPRRSG